MIRSFSIVALTTCVALPATAQGYEPMTTGGELVRWWEPQLEFHLGTAVPEEVDPAELEELVMSLLDQWIDAPCGLVPEASYGGLVDTDGPTPPSKPDNVIVFIRDKAAWHALSELDRDAGKPNQLAVTLPYYDPDSGRIGDADIMVNDAYHTFTLSDSPAAGEVRLQTVLLHELGHMYGMWHSGDREAVMAASYDVSLDELTQDDLDGICALYTDVPALPAPKDDGCGQGGSLLGGSGGALMALMMLLRRRRRDA